MNARLDADGNQVIEGDQVSIGLNYEAMSRKAFNLPGISSAGWTMPKEEEKKDD